MTAGVLDRPVTGQFELDGGGTLEELLSGTLREARASGISECPVCHAEMRITRAGAREAECGGCGSRLS
jgi:hypothetical protein